MLTAGFRIWFLCCCVVVVFLCFFVSACQYFTNIQFEKHTLQFNYYFQADVSQFFSHLSSAILVATTINRMSYTSHLMTGPEGNSESCFPRISMFPETKYSFI